MTPNEMSDLINSNQIDLRKLDGERLLILDGLQKKGVLQTKPIKEVLDNQIKTALEIAGQKEYEEDPIRAKTGDILNRDLVATIFDMGFFATQLMMDRKKLASLIVNPQKYAGQASKLKNVFSKKSTNQFAKALKDAAETTVTSIKGTPVARVIKPVIAGSLGYTAGGLAYDVADDLIRAKEGIESRGYKGDMEKNVFLRASDDMATGLAWNAGAELLAPITFGFMYGVRKYLAGMEGDHAKAIKEIAKKNGIEASYLEMSDPNSIGGKVIRTYNKVFGQLPFVGGPALAAKTKRTQQFTEAFEKSFNLQPNMHLAELASVSDQVARQMADNFVRFRGVSDAMYDNFRSMSKEFGDPMIIDLAHTRKLYNSILANDFAPAEFKMMIDNEMLQTSIGQFRQSLEALLKNNRKISPNEFLELQVRLNKAVANSPNNQEIIGAYKDFKKSLEKDFSSVNLNPGTEVFLKYPPQNANIANQILEPAQAFKKPIGEIEGAMGMKLNNEALQRLRTQLYDANNFYSNNIISFQSSLANKVVSAFDKNLFSEKQLAGFIESGRINKDQLAGMLANNIFKSGVGRQSFDAITDLQKLLEADVHKFDPVTGDFKLIKKGTAAGNDSLRRLFSSYISDAYQKSFKQSQGDTIFEDLLGKERKIELERLPGRTLDQLKTDSKLMEDKIYYGNMKFDPDEFRKLVFPTDEYRKKINMVFGKEAGGKMMTQLDDLMRYVEQLNSYDIPNASTFLARRLVLTGPGSLAAGGAMYGLGLPGTALMLFLGNRFNRILSNPKIMEKVNSTFKTYIELLDEGTLPSVGLPIMNRLLLDVIREHNNAYPNSPIPIGEGDVTTEELLDALSSREYDSTPPADIHFNKQDDERLFATVPEEDQKNVLPPPEYEDIVQILGGPPFDEDEEKMMANAVREMPPGSPLMAALPRLPGLPMTAPVRQQIQPQQFAAAFPQDDIGQLIANQRAQNA